MPEISPEQPQKRQLWSADSSFLPQVVRDATDDRQVRARTCGRFRFASKFSEFACARLSSHLMALQTANALLIIRSFTKYIIEIENESALLEQLNAKPANWAPPPQASSGADSSSSPQRLLKNLTIQPRIEREDSQEQNDGEADSVNNFQLQKAEGDDNEPLYMLITSILQLCIQVPVE